jgi:hypothetical protein
VLVVSLSSLVSFTAVAQAVLETLLTVVTAAQAASVVVVKAVIKCHPRQA